MSLCTSVEHRFSPFLQLSWLLFLFIVLPRLSSTAHAKVDLLDELENALGSATWYGHARIVRPLGKLSIGGTLYPINLVFNTNPADAPGAFGPYWRIPLFGSTAFQFNRYKLCWDGPDERRQFFLLDQSYEGQHGEQVFVERGKDWKATVDRRGKILIEALDDSGWVFRYNDGRLQEFKLGESTDTCRITWSGRDLPLYITNKKTNRRLFEIVYRGTTNPKRVIIGETQIEVKMGDGELTAPDGETNYRNYRVNFLRSLKYHEESTETFIYSKAKPCQRTIPVLKKVKKKASKRIDLKVNRMEVIDDTADEATDNWIEWEAKSGFITADSGSTYTVKNDSWDPNIQEGSIDITPSSVEMKRLLEGGTEQRWSYVWNSGVKVYTDLATGEVIRRTTIMSEGSANGKLRKSEVLKDGKWVLDRKNSYDPKGRPLRAVQGNNIRIWQWEDQGAFSRSTELLNGMLDRITTFNQNQEIIYREIYKIDGSIDLYRLERVDGRKNEYFTTKAGEKIQSQSIMVDGVTVFLENQHGIFEFIDTEGVKPKIELLNSKNPRLKYFNDKLKSALSLGN